MKTNQVDAEGKLHGLFILNGYKEHYYYFHGKKIGCWVMYSGYNKVVSKVYHIL